MDNFSPGSTVPVSGKYRCIFCGEGGLADFMRQELQGSAWNTPALQQFSNQSNQRYFEKGKTFPECPTCGPGTGWSLIENATVAQTGTAATHGEVVIEKVVCDICNGPLVSPYGYLLTTKQVVRSPEFWQNYYRSHEKDLERAGIRDYDQFRRHAAVRESVVKMFADQSNPWMICDSCINKFDADVLKTREYAERWWKDRTFVPPGGGPAELSSVRMKPKADHSALIAALLRGVIGFLMWAIGSTLMFVAARAWEIADRNPDAEGEAIALIIGVQLGLATFGSPICWLIWKYLFREKHGFGVLTFWFLCLLLGVIFYLV